MINAVIGSGFGTGGSGGGSPTGPAGGDLSGTYPNPGTAKINGTTVPAGGALTTGNVLQVSGVGAATYGPVNLAGGSNFITGTVPAGNLPAAAVSQVNGATVPASGSLTTGNVLQVSDVGALSYVAVNLAGGSNFVTGTLPSGNLPSATAGALGIVQLAGDFNGTGTAAAAPKIGTLTGVSGVITGPSTAITIGSNAASAGALRLATATLVTERNNANSADITLVGSNASDQVLVGDATNTAAVILTTKAAGSVQAKINATAVLNLGASNANDALTFGATPATIGNVRVYNGFTFYGRNAANSQDVPIITWNSSNQTLLAGNSISLVNNNQMSFIAATSAASIIFAARTTDIAAQDLTIRGQGAFASATGANLNGGHLVLDSGAAQSTGVSGSVKLQVASTNRLQVSATEITTAATLVSGVFTQAMADANQTVSAANSVNTLIITTGVLTAQRTLTLTTAPTAGAMKLVRNNCTANSISVAFSSGTGVVVAPSTAAWIYGDGTNAQTAMTGT